MVNDGQLKDQDVHPGRGTFWSPSADAADDMGSAYGCEYTLGFSRRQARGTDPKVCAEDIRREYPGGTGKPAWSDLKHQIELIIFPLAVLLRHKDGESLHVWCRTAFIVFSDRLRRKARQ